MRCGIWAEWVRMGHVRLCLQVLLVDDEDTVAREIADAARALLGATTHASGSIVAIRGVAARGAIRDAIRETVSDPPSPLPHPPWGDGSCRRTKVEACS